MLTKKEFHELNLCANCEHILPGGKTFMSCDCLSKIIWKICFIDHKNGWYTKKCPEYKEKINEQTKKD